MKKQMRIHLITCKVLQREAYYCAARSNNIIDITLMPKGLHDNPDQLRKEVQEKLKITHDVQGRPYDAVILGYALCSNGIEGLKSPIMMVVPRGHDCMTILLGSKQRYKEYFDSHKGIYWYSPGWIESDLMPGKERYDKLLAEYKEKYGEDNAEFLMDAEQNWMREYNWATFIDWDIFQNQKDKEYTKSCADFLGWNFDVIDGDLKFMQDLFDGKWDDEKYLVVQPGQIIKVDVNSERIIYAEKE